MLHSIHIFIGKGFEKMLDSVGRIIVNQHKEAAEFNHFINISKEKNSKISLEELNTQELASINAPLNDSQSVWCEKQSVSEDDLSEYWSDEIFDKVLNVSLSGQPILYVFIHLPLYRKETFALAKTLCQAIQASDRPVNIDFVSYCDDIARFIEPNSKEEPEPAYESRQAIKDLYNELNYSHQQNKFIVIQNRSINGVSILNDDTASDSLYDMVANLSLLFSAHYDDVFSLAQSSSRDVMGIGFSSLYFDRYAFSEYLLKKVMIKAIDNQNVNNNQVDINKATDAANEILKNKDNILSKFLEKWQGKEKENPDYDELRNEISGIWENAINYFNSCNDMTAKTAVLATLLSKTECKLFSSSLYSPIGTNFEDLYSEAIDKYIEEDSIEFYKMGDSKPINPIKELKNVNRKIVQSEVHIRSLEEQLNTYGEQIEKNKKVKECYIEDDFVIIGDNKYRMLPTVEEIPLEETYEAHQVTTESIDLRGNFSKIKHQGNQGSCLAFTLTSVFEYMMRFCKQEDCDLSEAFLYYNARSLDEYGSVDEDQGSRFVPALESLRTFGIALEKHCPYNDQVFNSKPSEEAYQDAATRKLLKALNVERNVNAIKSALSDGYPVAGSFNLFKSFFEAGAYIPMPSEQEMKEFEQQGEEEQNRHSRHAMVIVGYSDKLQRFLVRNSWGEEWGDKGYCYIPYSYIANENLFNFACIITEVDSLTSKTVELKEIPALEINNSDIEIRYYVTAAAYELEKETIEKYKQQKADLLQYLEIQKSIYADANTRDEFISANIKALEEKNNELKGNIQELRKKQDEIFESFKSIRKSLIIKASITAVSSFLLFLIWGFVGSFIGGFAALFTGTIAWISGAIMLLLIWLVYGIVIYIQFRSAYNEWREERDDLELQINNFNSTIAANEKRISLFRHKIFAAWVVITSLRALYPKLEQLYLKMVNLINNLRVWYEEAKKSVENKEFASLLPDISILSKERLDAFFENEISNSPVCEIDLCEGIDNYEITAEYLSSYKAKMKEMFTKRLFEKMESLGFNMSEHIATGKFSNIAIDVDTEMLSRWHRQAGIFLHVRSNERAVINTDNLIFASNLKSTRINLTKKLNNLEISSYGESKDRYKITLTRVATLAFDECVAFQPAKPLSKGKSKK